MDTSQGTNFSNIAHGFSISTDSSQGLLQQDTRTVEEEVQALLNDGLLVSGGNYSVTSVTVNDPGFWANVNYQIGDGHQPGRSNLAAVTTSEAIAGLITGTYDLSNPSPVADLPLALAYTHGVSNSLAEIDPLILDLDLDGIELTSFADGSLFFDIDNDGAVEKTGWLGADDAILVHDLNGDGVINDITETLSEYYGAAPGTGAVHASGFAALATLDGNTDGVIDAADASYASLRLWQDGDSDGVTDAGELSTLADAGVLSISLANTPDGAFTGGNEVQATGTYTLSGGVTATIAAVNFIADPNGLTRTASGAGEQIDLQDGLSVYSVLDPAGEAVDLAALGADAAIGGTGDDTLTGDGGDNWLTGSLGRDILLGGAGNDYLIADAADIAAGQAGIDGGDGFDIVQFVGTEGVAFNLQQSLVEMAVGTDEADILASGSSDHSIIAGGAGDDIILGGSADDVLNGEEGHDSIYGYEGDDLIRGHRGTDSLVGGSGEDVIFGGLGDDLIHGGEGDDLLRGDEGSDILDGGAGYDVAEYSGSYGDYALTDNGDGTLTVTDLRAGTPDGTDILTSIEALNFADINEVQTAGQNPLPVKDVVRIGAGQTGPAYTIAAADLLANDLDYQGDALQIREVFDAVGGTVSLSGSDVVFNVADGFTGVPSFSYRIEDAAGNFGAAVGVAGSTQTAEMTAQVTLVLPEHPDDPQFADQWYLPAINVLPVWKDYTGEGVSVGIVEPGPWDASLPGQLDYAHPDLAANVDAEWLRTVNPFVEPTTHATLVAGVIGAARNGIGGVGVAHEATLSSEGFTQAQIAANLSAVSAGWQRYDVVNHSWLPTTAFSYDFFPNVTIQDVSGSISTTWFDGSPFSDAVELGRGGLGTVFVSGAGNNRQDGSNANHFNFANSRQTITVAAINHEGDLGALQLAEEPFSNPGAPILVSAPGSNITSTSRLLSNANGSVFGSDYEEARGTSFATPIVSGVVALMLEANPNLGYRDVQKILAYSATQVDAADPGWSFNSAADWNGGGLHVSHDYGYGLVDARAAVRLAESWTATSTALTEALGTTFLTQVNEPINDFIEATYNQPVGDPPQIDTIEYVEVFLDLNHDRLGDLVITLISPSGTESTLLNRPGVTEENPDGLGGGHLSHLFTTTHHLGESLPGTWKIRITDLANGATGTWNSFELIFRGSNSADNTTYIYTDEFSGLGAGARADLTDTLGEDTLNASAITSDSVIDLREGSGTVLAGNAITISAGTVIETAYGGDGADDITGNASDNALFGGRGDDLLDGMGGADAIDGGEGIDTVSYASLLGGVGVNLGVTGADHTWNASEGDVLTNVENLIGSQFNDNMRGDAGDNRLEGGVGNDTLSAPTGSNVMLGGLGDDIINGGYGTDHLEGGEGDDKLRGFAGNDLLIGGAGADLLDGMGGIDTVSYATSTVGVGVNLSVTGADHVWSAAEGDVLTNVENLIGSQFNDNMRGDAGDNRLEGGDGNDNLSAASGSNVMLGGLGDDIISGGYETDHLEGGEGDDELRGFSGNDLLIGGAGADLLDGMGGVDTVSYATSTGGIGVNLSVTGADHTWNASEGDVLTNVENLIGSQFNDNMRGDAGDNRLEGGGGDDTLSAPFGNNVMLGGLGDDIINGGNGTDHLEGGEGDDELRGFSGDDLLIGGAGADLLDGMGGADVMDGGAGVDTVSYASSLGGVGVNLSVTGADHVWNAAEGDVLTNVENLIGSGFNDNMRGDAGDNRLEGGDGDDTLTAPSGSNVMLGGLGDDIINGGYETDHLEGGEGDDELRGFSGNDLLIGGAGADFLDGMGGVDTVSYATSTGGVGVNLSVTGADHTWNASAGDVLTKVENLIGSGFNDNMRGDAGDNRLEGGAGHDTLSAPTGSNVMLGGLGDDIINGGYGTDHLEGGEGDDELRGFSGNDLLIGGAGADLLDGMGGVDTVSYASSVGGVGVNLSVTGADHVWSAAEGDVLTNVENLIGSQFNDNLRGDAGDNRLEGGDGNDTLSAPTGSNVMLGGLGDDIINGGYGTDHLEGGEGDDELRGFSGNDLLIGGAGADLLDGMEGIDTASYASATGSVGVNLGASGALQTWDAALGDELVSIENLAGSGYNDTLAGDDGANVIEGGAGSDTLTGGNGSDTFVFDDEFGVDTVTDFDAHDDAEKIDLSGNSAIQDYADLISNHLATEDGHAVITDGFNRIRLEGVDIADLDALDFII